MIELGSKVRDKITGFEGIAIARTTYLTGCDRYGIQPAGIFEGKTADAEWYDETRLEILGPGPMMAQPPETVFPRNVEPKPEKPKTGGPQKDPLSRKYQP